ncbi:hypothetical protein [Amycolatopsis sp. CA-128772]|uniref:hypothetical protein n=1 Tax=Amycolatopsis sp. CA-128772 TaxID=2073159 RepID=UPI000CD0175C|nr:hypothetical protein [Amycolatopsis sp. CA-128772]
MVQTPSYFEYYNHTYVVESTPDGGLTGRILNWKTGDFEEKPEHVMDVLFDHGPDVRSLDRERFVRRTEEERHNYLRGDGPIFALYQTIDAIWAATEEEHRKISKEERALIDSIYRRTFKMWEDEFARRAAGEAPAFTFTSVIPQ